MYVEPLLPCMYFFFIWKSVLRVVERAQYIDIWRGQGKNRFTAEKIHARTWRKSTLPAQLWKKRNDEKKTQWLGLLVFSLSLSLPLLYYNHVCMTFYATCLLILILKLEIESVVREEEEGIKRQLEHVESKYRDYRYNSCTSIDNVFVTFDYIF